MTISQEVATSVESALIGARSPDGGWSAFGFGPSDTESTAWAVISLREHSGQAATAAAEGRQWLLQNQRSDGAWPLWPSVPQPGWTTALAVLALVAAGDAPMTAATRGGHWILDMSGSRIDWLGRVLSRLGWITLAAELDHSLAGWPWVPGTFGWVEPTSWAVLALRALGGSLPDEESRRRTDEATAFLIDRACISGGWNFGNPTVLGKDLRPYPDTTAIALLALVGTTGHPAIAAGVAALEDMLAGPSSRLALALGVLALRAHGKDVATLLGRLDEAWNTGGEDVVPTTRTRALTLLAVSGPKGPISSRDTRNANG